jgi:hypothetical protein
VTARSSPSRTCACTARGQTTWGEDGAGMFGQRGQKKPNILYTHVVSQLSIDPPPASHYISVSSLVRTSMRGFVITRWGAWARVKSCSTKLCF